MKCHFSFQAVNVSILYGESRLTRDTAVTRFLKHLTSTYLNAAKQFYHNENIYNESANLIDNCDVAFDTND